MRKVFLEKIFYDFLMISFCFSQFLSPQTFFSSLVVHTPVTRFKILTFKLKTPGRSRGSCMSIHQTHKACAGREKYQRLAHCQGTGGEALGPSWALAPCIAQTWILSLTS